jgi:EmrB/QacA subfamily drug resistance transporter
MQNSKKSLQTATLIVATLGAFLTPFMGSSINVALPAIAKEFSMNALLLSWIPTSYLLSSAVFLLPFGKLSDIYGKRRIFKWGIIIYTIFSFLTGIANSSKLLLIFRLLHGIGGAMIFGTSVALVTSVFGAGERGRALGITTASTYIGLSAGPFIGGILTQHTGWRSIFFFNALLGLVTLSVLLWKLKGIEVETGKERFDMKGSIIYGSFIISFMLGFSYVSKMVGILLITLSAFLFLIFLKLEEREENPMLNIGLFKNNRAFSFSNLATFIHYSASYSAGFLLSLYLQFIKGLDARTAGLILMARPVMMAIFSPFTGRASDKIEPRILASSGMGLTAFCFFLFIFLKEGTSIYFVLFNLLLHGIGFALFASPNTNAVMSSVEKKNYGIASATLATMRLTGQMFSMGIATLVISAIAGREKITSATLHLLMKSIKISMGISTVLCTAGIFASLARGNIRE